MMSHAKDRIHFRHQIMDRIGILFLAGALLAGCAVAPQPLVDIYLEPIEGRFDAHIDVETGAATVLKEGVAVTLKPLDEIELFSLTEEPRLNPYLLVEKNGAVEPIYTVFEVIVHNRKHRRVVVEDAAILIDGNGVQYANLSTDYFDALYDDVDRPQSGPWGTAYPYTPTAYGYYPYYGHYQSYIDTEALEWGRIVIEDSIFEGGKLFSGANGNFSSL